MSGRTPLFPAPSRTFLTILDQPWVDVETGKLTSWAGQFLLRLASYLGSVPPAGTPGAGLSVSALLQQLLEDFAIAPGLPGTDGATQQDIARLRQLVSLLLPSPRPPSPEEAPDPLPPAPRPHDGPEPLAPWWLSGTGTGMVLQQGTVSVIGTVEIGPFLVLAPGTLDGEVWMPMVNGSTTDPEIIVDSYGQPIAVRIR